MKHASKFVLLAILATMMASACAVTPEEKGEQYAKAMVTAIKNGDQNKIEKISDKVSDYSKGLSLSDRVKFTKSFYGNLAKLGYNEAASGLQDLFE